MKAFEKILTEERLSYVREKRKQARAEGFLRAEDKIGSAAIASLKRLYEDFDERIYIWLAGLYDGECGAFYYSASARDTHLYLPDIESTFQALKFLNTSGMIGRGEGSYVMRLPEFLRRGAVAFAKGLQAEDGYFYHLQWGRDISVSRRGRDLSWCKNLLREAGEVPNYPLPTDKGADGKRSPHLPEYLESLTAFRKYLSEMDLASDSYRIGNIFESTSSQITAAGEEYGRVLAEWFISGNRPDNGLWQEGISYATVNGLMKISGVFPHLRIRLPHAARSLESAIFALNSDERMKFVCEAYNPWAAIINIMKANKGEEGDSELAGLRSSLIENAPALIDKTREKIAVFRKPDGSYSYFRKMSSAVSQRAPVAVPRTDEGDVNATTICVGSTVRSMREALDIPAIPVFCPEDGELFFELLKNVPKVKKTNYIGEVFPEKPSYGEEIGEADA